MLPIIDNSSIMNSDMKKNERTTATTDAAGDPRPVAIGELVSYELRVQVGEGILTDVILRDLLTDGLVLISRFEYLGSRGFPLEEAVVEGSLSKLRPVLMTTLTTALGLLPLILTSGVGSEIQRPLAIVVVGGLTSSTLLTLIVLPVLYVLVHKDTQT